MEVPQRADPGDAGRARVVGQVLEFHLLTLRRAGHVLAYDTAQVTLDDSVAIAAEARDHRPGRGVQPQEDVLAFTGELLHGQHAVVRVV